MLGFSIKNQHRLLLLVFLLCLSTTDANAGFLTPRVMRDMCIREKSKAQQEEQSCVLEINQLKRAYKRNPTAEIAEQIASLTAKREKIQKEIEEYDRRLSFYTPYEFSDTILHQGHLYSTNFVIPVKDGGIMSLGLFLSESDINVQIAFRGYIEDSVGKIAMGLINTGENIIKKEFEQETTLKNQTIRLNNKNLYSNNALIILKKELMQEAFLEMFFNPLKENEIKYDDRYYVYTVSFVSSLLTFDTSKNINNMTGEDRTRYMEDKINYIIHKLTEHGIGNIEFGGHTIEFEESSGRILSTIEQMIEKWRKSDTNTDNSNNSQVATPSSTPMTLTVAQMIDKPFGIMPWYTSSQKIKDFLTRNSKWNFFYYYDNTYICTSDRVVISEPYYQRYNKLRGHCFYHILNENLNASCTYNFVAQTLEDAINAARSITKYLTSKGVKMCDLEDESYFYRYFSGVKKNGVGIGKSYNHKSYSVEISKNHSNPPYIVEFVIDYYGLKQ